jgi:hypothetical protein
VARPEPGSSINSSASEIALLVLVGSNLLVTAVLKNNVMLICGMTEFSVGATPPVQMSVTSPVCSV